MSWLRSLMLLALVVWVGGIAFLAFVEAPSAFQVLPDQHLAGLVVGRSLTILHCMGIISACIFLLSSITLNYLSNYQLRLFSASHVFVVLMLALTLLSQFCITPRMREVRAGMDNSAARAEFDRLHKWSERTEGGVLFLGLVLVVLTARRNST
ncbi:MAG TPA: DUF4149 domain-containing protein [Verrucomicrobiae bacterium]|jgi:uncharacterized membrane protein|nr:DUF4149 domain-containing protein [Verrucomicrobiae bacterium]